MSSFKEGQVHQLVEAMERAGFTPEHLTRLGQNSNLLRQISGVLSGTHEIKIKDLISRVVRVDRSLSPEQALEVTGRRMYVDKGVVATMPRGDKDEEEVFFVKRELWTSNDDWDVYLDSLGLKPCDPYTLAKVNEDDPGFADEHPNGTHWKDSEGKWCFVAFSRWGGERGRGFGVDRSDDDWAAYWWFAGVRK